MSYIVFYAGLTACLVYFWEFTIIQAMVWGFLGLLGFWAAFVVLSLLFLVLVAWFK